MYKTFLKFNNCLAFIVSVIGIQFLALPFYHFHPDTQHSHSGQSLHHHNAYFHSIELESIVNLTHSQDHHSNDHHSHDQHSQHSKNTDEVDSGVQLNSETLKSKNPFKVLKVVSTFTAPNIQNKLKTYYLPIKLNKFNRLVIQQEIRDRSPPFYLI